MAELPKRPTEIIIVVQKSGDGTSCSLTPGLASGSGSTSTIAAADQESFGVLLGGGPESHRAQVKDAP